MVSVIEWLAEASVNDEVFLLRPDYVAGLAVAAGLGGGPSDDDGEALLVEAEDHAARIGVAESEAIVAWREAYRGFGVKPKRARSSVDALAVPIGAEDVDCYVGPLRLVRAAGEETFLQLAPDQPHRADANQHQCGLHRRRSWPRCPSTGPGDARCVAQAPEFRRRHLGTEVHYRGLILVTA